MSHIHEETNLGKMLERYITIFNEARIRGTKEYMTRKKNEECFNEEWERRVWEAKDTMLRAGIMAFDDIRSLVWEMKKLGFINDSMTQRMTMEELREAK